MKNILFIFFVLFFISANKIISQTAMSPGDMAIVKFVSGSGTDNVSLLALKEISCGTNFIFTDNNWDAGSASWTCNNDEFAVGFTTTSILKAGTIVNIEVNPIGNLTVLPYGTLTFTNLGNPWGTNAGLNSGGDNGFILQGTRAAPIFIYGLKNNGLFSAGGNCSDKDFTGLPAALTLASTALNFTTGVGYRQYNCAVMSSNTAANLLASISNTANWSTAASAQSFTVTDAFYNPTGAIGVSGAGCGCLSGCNLTTLGGPNCGAGVAGSCAAGEINMSTDIVVPAGCTYYVTATMRTWTATGCGSSGADGTPNDQLKVDIPAGPKPFLIGPSNAQLNDSYTLTGPGTIRVSGSADRADEVIVYRAITSPCSTCGQLVLPIELTQFNATLLDDGVNLKWTTVAEINNDFFTIERSANTDDWEAISFINGLVNSHTYTSYSIFDHSPLAGVSYYRLKQTDKNGRFTYSGIIFVENNHGDQKIIKRVNIYGQEVDENATGLIILIYDKGEVKKIFK